MTDQSEPRLLALASNRLFWKPGDAYIYPFAVDVDLRESPPAVWVSEGVTFSAVGAKLTAAEALSSEWEEHFVKAEAEWLRPYLERISQGKDVTHGELVSSFRRIHGKDPMTIA